jgi:SSS family solute:Na+ symporter
MIVFLEHNPEFKASLPGDHYDYLLPLFIVNYLPHGVIGFVLVGIFAAAMSSLDSAINSLSAATIKDLVVRFPTLNGIVTKRFIFYSRLTTLVWGTLCTFFAYLVGSVSSTVIEGINKIGSVFYGPLLAVFALGILVRSAKSTGVVTGLFAGIAANIGLWVFCPGVSWLWWNVVGCVVACVVGITVSFLSETQVRGNDRFMVSLSGGWKNAFTASAGRGRCCVLAMYFVILIIVLLTYREWRGFLW